MTFTFELLPKSGGIGFKVYFHDAQEAADYASRLIKRQAESTTEGTFTVTYTCKSERETSDGRTES